MLLEKFRHGHCREVSSVTANDLTPTDVLSEAAFTVPEETEVRLATDDITFVIHGPLSVVGTLVTYMAILGKVPIHKCVTYIKT